MRKIVVALMALFAASVAFASENAGGSDWRNLYFIAMGIAAFGGTTAQSKAAAAALKGIARNPSAVDKIQTPMILALALMESLVIFTLISVFLI